jgi:hypothetical protein
VEQEGKVTREEAKKIIGELLLFGKAPCKKEELKDLCKVVLTALEQEPTDKNFTKADIDAIVKAINAHWELIIDEIRAEVEMEKLEDSPNFCVKAHNNAVDRALQILDKYKESEDQDGQTSN